MSTPERTIERTRRHRSPSYPAIAIDDAIDRVRQVYERDRRAFTSVEAILEHLGYSTRGGGSGTSGRVISAMRQYGLLDEQGGQYRVSDLAFRILNLPEESADRAGLIRDAALTPPIFRNLLNFYQGEIPSDATLRGRLVLQEGFNPDSIDQFIRVFRRTISIANPSVADYTEGEDINAPEQETATSPMSQTGLRTPTREETARAFASGTASQLHALGVPVPEGRFTEDLNTRIADDCKVRILFDGPVTREAIQKLKRYLDLIADDYPARADAPLEGE